MSSKPATFDDAPPPGTINFGVGQPSLDLLPVDLMRAASERYLGDAVSAELNYGPLQGDARFRESLAELLNAEHGPGVRPDQLMLSGGNSQA
ncbi:MAG: aminotransferase class I/II-fold pyridoxal phosphate-dependent enzyme, partial [Pseudomonadota bacterium]